MRLFVLAALAALVAADVSELINYRYNVPASSYGVPQSSVTERNFNALPTSPSLGLHLPIFESQNFNAFNPYPGVVSTTAAPFLDGLVSSTPAPSFDTNSLFSSTPAPSLLSNFGFSTPAPSVSVNSAGSEALSGSVSSTPTPHVVATSGSQESLNVEPQLPNFGFNAGLNAYTTPSPLFSTTVAPGNNFGLDFGSQFNNFPGFGLNAFSTAAPITLGSGSLTSLGSNVFGNDAALNSVNIQGFTQGGNLGDAFGVSSASVHSAGILPQSQQVSRHVFFYAAPEDPEPARTRVNIAPVPPPKKNVKVIFIKAPAPPAPAPISIAAPPQDEQKTVVYVLVKKPDEIQNIEIQTPPPTAPAKPEIFFIKYKTPQEAEEAIAKVQSNHASENSVPANTVTGGGLLSSIHNEVPITPQPFVNYVSSTTTPSPLFNFLGGGISGPIGGGGLNYVSPTSIPAPQLGLLGGGISGPIGGGGFNFYSSTSTPAPQLGLLGGGISGPLGGGGFNFISSTSTPAPQLGLLGGGISGPIGGSGLNFISSTSTPAPQLGQLGGEISGPIGGSALNYISSTSTPAPQLGLLGGGLSGPIGGDGFNFISSTSTPAPQLNLGGISGGGIAFNPQLEADISQNLIGGQSLYSTPSPLISSTGDLGLVGSSTTVAPPVVPHSTYGPPFLKK